MVDIYYSSVKQSDYVIESTELDLTAGRDAEDTSMPYEYKVVPFIGQSRGRVSPDEVATQLEAVIRQYVALGWEFYQLSDVNIEVQPGCLAGLLGAKAQYARFDQIIFRADQRARTRSAADIRTRSVAKSTSDEDRASSKSRSDHQERRTSLPVTSRHVAVWREKSDEQLRDAIAVLHEYTDEGRAVVLAEFERRSLEPITEAERATLDKFRKGAARPTLSSGRASSNTTGSDLDEQDAVSYCYHCGADVPVGSQMCVECGKSL
jgi:hypothetical protein